MKRCPRCGRPRSNAMVEFVNTAFCPVARLAGISRTLEVSECGVIAWITYGSSMSGVTGSSSTPTGHQE